MDIVILKGVPAGVCSCHQDSGRQVYRWWSFSDPSELEGWLACTAQLAWAL